jgi:hypothetical protein
MRGRNVKRIKGRQRAGMERYGRMEHPARLASEDIRSGAPVLIST